MKSFNFQNFSFSSKYTNYKVIYYTKPWDLLSSDNESVKIFRSYNSEVKEVNESISEKIGFKPLNFKKNIEIYDSMYYCVKKNGSDEIVFFTFAIKKVEDDFIRIILQVRNTNKDIRDEIINFFENR